MSESREFKVGPSIPERVFVEIGYGDDPAFFGCRRNDTRTAHFRGVHYIGLDINSDTLGTVLPALTGEDSEKANPTDHMLSIGFNAGRLIDLNLPEGSVDEFYLSGVFSECRAMQDFHCASVPRMELVRALGDMTDPETKRQVLQELYPKSVDHPLLPLSGLLNDLERARTLLSYEGQIVIVENRALIDQESVEMLLDSIGLAIIITVTKKEPAWAFIHDVYNMPDDGDEYVEPFAMIVHPKAV